MPLGGITPLFLSFYQPPQKFFVPGGWLYESLYYVLVNITDHYLFSYSTVVLVVIVFTLSPNITNAINISIQYKVPR